MRRFSILIFFAASSYLISCNVVRKTDSPKASASGVDLSGYRKLDSINYVGTGYMKFVTSRKNYAIVNFVFEPGARNNWHSHPGAEQVLYVTEGEGFYQQEGKPKQLIKKGDVIVVPPDTKHWNGATDKKRLVHVSISDIAPQGHVTWFSPVSQSEYLK
jgi:quercetin dioxygenase-like cupin family protein